MKIIANKRQIIYLVINITIVLSVIIGITAIFFPDNYHRYLSSPGKILGLIGVGLLTCIVCVILGGAIRFSTSNSKEN